MMLYRCVVFRARDMMQVVMRDGRRQGARRVHGSTKLIMIRCRSSPKENGEELGESSALVRARWVVGLVGTAAASWSVARFEDATLAEKLCELAKHRPFAAWTST